MPGAVKLKDSDSKRPAICKEELIDFHDYNRLANQLLYRSDLTKQRIKVLGPVPYIIPSGKSGDISPAIKGINNRTYLKASKHYDQPIKENFSAQIYSIMEQAKKVDSSRNSSSSCSSTLEFNSDLEDVDQDPQLVMRLNLQMLYTVFDNIRQNIQTSDIPLDDKNPKELPAYGWEDILLSAIETKIPVNVIEGVYRRLSAHYKMTLPSIESHLSIPALPTPALPSSPFERCAQDFWTDEETQMRIVKDIERKFTLIQEQIENKSK
ncbi:hypothetical protein PHYBLDRAFT_148026 [Phycomyces blakesleeanus NRRL 1555(-)]|uniref:Uncharacterized protein n=1 Tax=Phycomyces blakesleeanus (strain ATCC 8743b / DSM 1359 / FGSC 10004 / NBRC 33097 / NRRL 1555) TaxID=763407 RepID=A0A162TYA5_PHYB8|nr:hypothetical protein PHYBLDRAFT_148026 [Phycomyces blakesleeanus NRRL 1555(-)]OAD70803.1 hypothetical protein PHYBLDRAFT_148026 [Phycomyces blakesleeanus NRRL 1555(-)]|eukprot:XP_018288843.1 hypothetical protein PHYBLDRAFT_148026 [Phycomyces blakesleeanus NRRL 1555(-)]